MENQSPAAEGARRKSKNKKRGRREESEEDGGGEGAQQRRRSKRSRERDGSARPATAADEDAATVIQGGDDADERGSTTQSTLLMERLLARMPSARRQVPGGGVMLRRNGGQGGRNDDGGGDDDDLDFGPDGDMMEGIGTGGLFGSDEAGVRGGGGGGDDDDDDIPDEEWIAETMSSQNILFDTDQGGFNPETDDHHHNDPDAYCAGCYSNPDGKYPPIDRSYIDHVDQLSVEGLRTGRPFEYINSIYVYWNYTVRTAIEKGLENDPRYGKDYEPLPEWTLGSIKRHIVAHTKDPVNLSVRCALKIDAIAEGLANHSMVFRHYKKRDERTGKPVVKYDPKISKLVCDLYEKSAKILRETHATYAPKSNGKDSTGKQFFKGGGTTMSSAKFRDNVFMGKGGGKF
jgi:hypothetical protein